MVSVKVASMPEPSHCSRTWQCGRHAVAAAGLHSPVERVLVSGWYLRGDIGMTNQQFKGLHQPSYDVAGTHVEEVAHGLGSSTFFGLASAISFNDWFRADFTGEYRGKANFHGSDNVTFNGGRGVDNYTGSKSEWCHGQCLRRSRTWLVRDAVYRCRASAGPTSDQWLPR